MRIFVMFDLPVTTKAQSRAATKFRELLLDEGFERSQFSTYSSPKPVFAAARRQVSPSFQEYTCTSSLDHQRMRASGNVRVLVMVSSMSLCQAPVILTHRQLRGAKRRGHPPCDGAARKAAGWMSRSPTWAPRHGG
jgi:CRISPR/Cas system-associated protein endoribonuclease Cas2